MSLPMQRKNLWHSPAVINKITRSVWLVALAVTLPVTSWADRHKMASTPLSPLYIQECGSCHVAFPPGLLTNKDWHQVMTMLDKHYGDNATLEEKTKDQLTTYLIQHSGQDSKFSGEETPPKLTTTRWFRREHHEVPTPAWATPQVKSAANCVACHRQAEKGDYREENITIPGYGRWEDD